MKVYRYKFSTLVLVLIIVCLALCAAAFSINLALLIGEINEGISMNTFKVLRYVLMFVVPAILFVILVSLLASSKYVVTGTTLKTCFGFIVSCHDIMKMTVIVLDKNTDKLTVTFTDESFIVIVVKQNWYDDFIKAILDINSEIEYDVAFSDGNSKKDRHRRGKDDNDDKKDE